MADLRKSALVSLAVLAIGLLCGCGVGKPILMSEEPALTLLKQSYPFPLAYQVGIETHVSEKEGSKGMIDANELGRGVAEVLRGSVFNQVTVNDPESRYKLKLNLTDFELKYAGRSTVFVPSILLWAALTSVGSMFIGDECYTADGLVQVILEDSNGQVLWLASFQVGARCNLDDFQRGWTGWDLYIPGALMAHPNTENASKHVLPHFYRDVQLKMIEAVRGKPLPLPTTDCAIVIGVEKFPEGTNASAQYAAEDAQAVGQLLKERGGSYLEGTFNILAGEVDGTQILNMLRNLGKRGDLKFRRVVFYYAGCGQVVTDSQATKHKLLTSTGPLDLKELLEKLSSLRGASCAVILDCGFSGKTGRCVPFEGTAPPRYPESVMKSDKVAVLFACAPGQSAYENSDTGHGVFTSIALATLEQLPPAQEVTLKMLGSQTGFEVSRQARERGAELQEPIANAADAVLLPQKGDKR